MTIAIPATTFAHASPRWRRHEVVLALVAAALLAIFASDVAQLGHIWWTSTTFGHCLFIGPVIAWLVWQRRAELARLTPVAWAPGLAWVGLGGVIWLIGDASFVGLLRQVGLIVMLQGACITLLGPAVARGLTFPLGYAFFLVPFGEWLEAPLQHVTVAMVLPMLHLVGIAATSDGVLIHAARTTFEVAEACSGAKFVIAMLAFGTLVAHLCFWSWRRRAVFLAVSLTVPVIANGLRAFATIWAAAIVGVERATGFDHIVYGWLFFGIVMAATLALGWRWFDRAPDAPAFDPTKLQRPVCHRLPLVLAAIAILLTAGIFPAWSAAVGERAAPLPAHIEPPSVPGWHRIRLSTAAPWTPYHPGADHLIVARYADNAGEAVDLAIAVYGHQREGAKLLAFGTGVLREEDRWVRVATLPPIASGTAMRIASGPVGRVVAAWYDVGGVLTANPLRVKWETLRARLGGGRASAVVIYLSAETGGTNPVRAIERFRQALPSLEHVAATVTGA